MWLKNTILLLSMKNLMFERSELVHSEVNCMIFTGDSETEIAIPFPKEEISEAWYKEVSVMSFICSFFCAAIINAIDLCLFYAVLNKRLHAMLYNETMNLQISINYLSW